MFALANPGHWKINVSIGTGKGTPLGNGIPRDKFCAIERYFEKVALK